MLPQHLKTNPEFAKSISTFASNRMQTEMLQYVPSLRGDAPFLRRFFVLSKKLGFDDTVKEFLPSDLFSDGDFMLEMCSKNVECIGLVSPSLLADKAFLDALLARNVGALGCIPPETQLLFHELVRNAIPFLCECDRDTQERVASNLDPLLWEDRAFALAWFSAGLPDQDSSDDPPCPSERYREDEEIMLVSLKHKSLDYSFMLPSKLLKTRDFVLKAVRVHPWVFFRVDQELRSDHFVFTKFAAHSSRFTKHLILDMHFRGKDDVIQEHLRFIRSELNKYIAFLEFVCGATVNRGECPLLMLNQGAETFLRLKKRLALEFLQIPTGEWLNDLRQAEKNVTMAMQPWALDS
eukprot:scaffold6655_cov169-Amphora_coffeaeformis.AAC.12